MNKPGRIVVKQAERLSDGLVMLRGIEDGKEREYRYFSLDDPALIMVPGYFDELAELRGPPG